MISNSIDGLQIWHGTCYYNDIKATNTKDKEK